MKRHYFSSKRNPQIYQRGMTLFVSLMMLVAVTLIIVSSVRMNTVNLKIAGNMQQEKELIAVGQQALETVVGDVANFYTPVARVISVPSISSGGPGYSVSVSAPVCQKTAPVGGFSAEFVAATPQDTYWDIQASVTDSLTGATAVIHQGVAVRLDSTGTCP